MRYAGTNFGPFGGLGNFSFADISGNCPGHTSRTLYPYTLSKRGTGFQMYHSSDLRFLRLRLRVVRFVQVMGVVIVKVLL